VSRSTIHTIFEVRRWDRGRITGKAEIGKKSANFRLADQPTGTPNSDPYRALTSALAWKPATGITTDIRHIGDG
jgi:hypothetical protein